MNPYVENYVRINAREQNGQLVPFSREVRSQLTPQGKLLAARLMRVQTAEQKVVEKIVESIHGIGCLLGFMLCLTWVSLVVTDSSFLKAVYETANRHFPWGIGAIFFYDTAPLFWLTVIGMAISFAVGAIAKRRFCLKAERIRSRILTAHPLLPEAIQGCTKKL